MITDSPATAGGLCALGLGGRVRHEGVPTVQVITKADRKRAKAKRRAQRAARRRARAR